MRSMWNRIGESPSFRYSVLFVGLAFSLYGSHYNKSIFMRDAFNLMMLGILLSFYFILTNQKYDRNYKSKFIRRYGNGIALLVLTTLTLASILSTFYPEMMLTLLRW